MIGQCVQNDINKLILSDGRIDLYDNPKMQADTESGVYSYEKSWRITRLIVEYIFPWLVLRIQIGQRSILLKRISAESYIKRNFSRLSEKNIKLTSILPGATFRELVIQKTQDLFFATLYLKKLQKIVREKDLEFDTIRRTFVFTKIDIESLLKNTFDWNVEQIQQFFEYIYSKDTIDHQSSTLRFEEKDFVEATLQVLRKSHSYPYAGIKNAGNSCYISSALQAFNACAVFKNIISSYDIANYPAPNDMVEEEKANIKQIFALLQTILELINQGITIDAKLIQKLRENLIIAKFSTGKKDQEDCAYLVDFIMYSKVLFNRTTLLETKIIHGLNFSVNCLEPQRVDRGVYHVRIGESAANQSFEDILLSNTIYEEYSAKNVKVDGLITPKKANRIKEELKDQVHKLPTLQTLRVQENNQPPKVLPFALDRFAFAKDTILKKKLNTYIKPSYTIQIPCRQNGVEKQVVYELRAIIVHEGLSTDSGHYFTYTIRKTNNGYQWIEFNDHIVTVHTDYKRPCEIAAKDGYLFFYELSEVRDSDQERSSSS